VFLSFLSDHSLDLLPGSSVFPGDRRPLRTPFTMTLFCVASFCLPFQLAIWCSLLGNFLQTGLLSDANYALPGVWFAGMADQPPFLPSFLFPLSFPFPLLLISVL